MKRLSLLALALSVSIGLIAVGCDSTGPALESGNGTLELRMAAMSPDKASSTRTAAPDSGGMMSNIDSASVTITRTAIIAQEEPDTSQADTSSADSLGGIKVLTEQDFVVDLVDLQSGLDTLMANVDLEPGTYTQLRLITADQATVVFADSTEREVMVASGQETGFKVNFKPFTIDSADDKVQITIQWDVENSLKGNRRGRLVITPVIQATVDTSGT